MYRPDQRLRECRALAEIDPVNIEMVKVTADRNLRTIRLIGRQSDGKWEAETLTTITGATLSSPTKVRLSEQTLARHYKPI